MVFHDRIIGIARGHNALDSRVQRQQLFHGLFAVHAMGRIPIFPVMQQPMNYVSLPFVLDSSNALTYNMSAA